MKVGHYSTQCCRLQGLNYILPLIKIKSLIIFSLRSFIFYFSVSGLSPFLGDQEAETLVNVTMAQWDFEDDTFDEISEDAKDFISSLLVKDIR